MCVSAPTLVEHSTPGLFVALADDSPPPTSGPRISLKDETAALTAGHERDLNRENDE